MTPGCRLPASVNPYNVAAHAFRAGLTHSLNEYLGYRLLDSRLGWLRDGDNARLLRRGLRGLEKESLRVDREGRLSRRPHPHGLGAALTHPYLTTDYSEAMLEFENPELKNP